MMCRGGNYDVSSLRGTLNTGARFFLMPLAAVETVPLSTEHTCILPLTVQDTYIPSGTATAIICLVIVLIAVLLRFVHLWENKKLERNETEGGEFNAAEDRSGQGFRYVY